MLFFNGLAADTTLLHESQQHVGTTNPAPAPPVAPAARPMWQYALGGLAILVIGFGIYSYAAKHP